MPLSLREIGYEKWKEKQIRRKGCTFAVVFRPLSMREYAKASPRARAKGEGGRKTAAGVREGFAPGIRVRRGKGAQNDRGRTRRLRPTPVPFSCISLISVSLVWGTGEGR